MIKAPVALQDLRRKIYAKAKADASWRFWGLYVHVCKMETLRTAFERAKENDGAPGIDGVTFAAIEEQGVDKGWGHEGPHSFDSHYTRPCRTRGAEADSGTDL